MARRTTSGGKVEPMAVVMSSPSRPTVMTMMPMVSGSRALMSCHARSTMAISSFLFMVALQGHQDI
jgi:hypothetical protein